MAFSTANARGREVCNGSDLDVGWGAMRQNLVQLVIERSDLVARHRRGVWSQEARREGGLCNGQLMGRHAAAGERRLLRRDEMS